MFNFTLKKSLLILICLFPFAKIAFADSNLETKDSTPLLSEPKGQATVVKSLGKGEKVSGIERKGMFWKVKTVDGTEGFVSIIKVQSKNDDAGGGVADALRANIQSERNDNDAANMRSRSTVMGVRGLDSDGQVKFAGSVKPNLRLVFQMENMLVTEKEVTRLESLVQEEIVEKAQKSQ